MGNDIKAISGGSIKLRCMLKSTENVKITWLKNGRILPRNSPDVIVGNTLIIKDTKNGGNFTYTCALSGLMGTAKQSSRIEIIRMLLFVSYIFVCVLCRVSWELLNSLRGLKSFVCYFLFLIFLFVCSVGSHGNC